MGWVGHFRHQRAGTSEHAAAPEGDRKAFGVQIDLRRPGGRTESWPTPDPPSDYDPWVEVPSPAQQHYAASYSLRNAPIVSYSLRR